MSHIPPRPAPRTPTADYLRRTARIEPCFGRAHLESDHEGLLRITHTRLRGWSSYLPTWRAAQPMAGERR